MEHKINVIQCKQNGRLFFIGVMNRDVLRKNCFVSRADEDISNGFQRLLNNARAVQIAKYLDNHNGVIPSALILSAQSKSNFKFNDNKGEATFEADGKNFMVLDGQHRLFGLIKATENFEIPVVIFKDLKPEEEVNLFIDINTNQKGVSSSLLLDIKKHTGKEDSIEEKQRSLFDDLSKNSVLAGKLSPRGTTVGQISRKAFNDATKSMFEGGPFANAESKHVLNGVKNYLEACELILNDVKSKNATLLKTIVFKAMFQIFYDVIETSLKKYGNIKVESLEKVLTPITLLNFDNYNGSSAALVNQIGSDMRREIIRSNDLSIDLTNDLF